jgi:hypothetical protein
MDITLQIAQSDTNRHSADDGAPVERDSRA